MKYCYLIIQLFLSIGIASNVQAKKNSSGVVPAISIVSNDGTYTEAVGGLCFSVSITNPLPDTTFVDVQIVASTTGTLGTDFTIAPTRIKFLPNFAGNESVCVSIFEDLLAEPIETYSFMLANPSNNATLGDSLINFTIYDNDSITTSNPCSDIFFSEFVHSFSAGDRAFELYNPTGQVVDLSNYSIKIYFAGNTVAGTDVPLSGFINHGDTYVISYSGSDSAVKAISDLVNGQFFFNGNSAIGLYHNATLVDCFGTIGVNPGFGWPVYNANSTSATLVRKQNIKQGESNWNNSNGQWDIFPQADYSHLGSHTINGCGFIVPPTVTMFTSDASFNEAVGGLSISVKIFNPLAVATTVDVVLGNLTTATLNSDFTFTPSQLTFPANSTVPQSISISIVDDLTIEPDEILELRLQNVSGSATILDSSWVLTIQNDDFTGISEIKTSATHNLQPNPVKDILKFTSNNKIDSYQITNFLGQVYKAETNINSSQLNLNLQDLKPGMYFIVVKEGTNNLCKRFIKD